MEISEVHESLREWPKSVPADATRTIRKALTTDGDVAEVVEYFDADGKLLCQCSHAMRDTLDGLPENLRFVPDNLPANARREIHVGELPENFWAAVEYYGDNGEVLSRSAHVAMKRGFRVNVELGDFNHG